MKFESPGQVNKTEDDSSKEKLVVSAESYQQEKKLKAEVEGRRDHLARIFAASLTLFGATNEAAALSLKDLLSGSFVAESETLTENVSAGRVKLSSGEEIVVPKQGDLFERVTVYTPTGKDPDRLILLFSQTHKVSKEQLERINPDEHQYWLNEAVDSQRRIYHGLKELIAEGSLSAVCTEGVSSWDSAYNTLDWYANYNLIATSSAVANYLPGSDIEQALNRRDALLDNGLTMAEQQELETQIEPVMHRYSEEYKYLIGAEQLLAAEGEITICPGEGEAAYNNLDTHGVNNLLDKPTYTWTPEERSSYQRYMYEDREDAALEAVLTNMPDKVIGLSFGAAHDFTNNLEKWNLAHPDEQVGIVEMRAPYH